MQADYYREYYHLERTNWWFVARKEILRNQVARIFPKRNNLKILNVGAALGASTIMLQEFGNVTSIEYNKYCCDFVNDNFKLDFIHGSITELPFKDNEFDLVCAFDVVEHVQEDVLAISELHRVCKPGGYTFTTVPTFKFLWSEHDIINEHVRRYTMKNYLSLFDKEIARIHFKSYFNFFLFPPVAVFRVLSSAVKKPGKNKDKVAKSDNSRVTNKFISKMLYRIFKTESHFLKRNIKFPVGISLMVITNKLSKEP
jgi:ubiquinone/menaquinone biosynthesis C-methylase UbiE